MLNDVAGKPIRAWDSRGHNFTTDLRRAAPPGRADRARHHRQRRGRLRPAHAEPRHPGRQDRVRRTDAMRPGRRAQRLNLRTRIYRHFDSAGVATNARLDANGNPIEAYDFKGNLLRSTRHLVSDYKAIPDWSAEPRRTRRRDLRGQHPLRRAQPPHPVHRAAQQPDPARHPNKLNVIQPVFNEANLLERVDVWLERAAEPAGAAGPGHRGAVAGRRRQHRLRRQGPAPAHRLQATAPRTTYAYDPRDLPPDPSLHPARRGLPRTTATIRSRRPPPSPRRSPPPTGRLPAACRTCTTPTTRPATSPTSRTTRSRPSTSATSASSRATTTPTTPSTG